jgi:hypothetical protein
MGVRASNDPPGDLVATAWRGARRNRRPEDYNSGELGHARITQPKKRFTIAAGAEALALIGRGVAYAY